MPQIHLDEETIGRLDALRADGEEYDAIVGGLIDSCEGRGESRRSMARRPQTSRRATQTETRDESDANGDA